MATDYYLGNGKMSNYGHSYDMSREELVKVLDRQVAIVKQLEVERDELQKQVLSLKYPYISIPEQEKPNGL